MTDEQYDILYKLIHGGWALIGEPRSGTPGFTVCFSLIWEGKSETTGMSIERWGIDSSVINGLFDQGYLQLERNYHRRTRSTSYCVYTPLPKAVEYVAARSFCYEI